MGLTIVQVGANRGKDDLTSMIQQLPPSAIDRLVLIEPLTVHYDQLSACYQAISNKLIINNVITHSKNTGSIVEFWYHTADAPGYEVASISKDHIRKHHNYNPAFLDESGYRSVKSYAISLNQLFSMMSLNYIDILFVDAEGHDSSIIQDIDFHTAKISNIFFENLHLPEGNANPEASVYDFLEKNGYAIKIRCLSNGWMSHAELKLKNKNG